MIITIPWLKEHLKTSAKESEIIDSLTNIGLEVEGVKENSGEMSKFKIAKVVTNIKGTKNNQARGYSFITGRTIPIDQLSKVII